MSELRSYLKFTLSLIGVLAVACTPAVLDADTEDDAQVEDKTDVSVFEPAFGTTVYGTVLCDGVPVTGAVVSDGYDCVKTDKDGYYQLASKKTHGYVFVSVPSGYKVETDGTLPLFHKYLTRASSKIERVDFTLLKDEDQQKHTMVVLGDIQLAGINDDVAQFREFIADLNGYMAADPSQKFYGLTVGDMSYDRFWLSNAYDLYDYLDEINALKDIPVFNTIGNHDHELMAQGDFYSAIVYKRVIGPTYYSFNIGEVHYVVLDNIECMNSGTGDLDYEANLVTDQLNWLRRDLSYVSADTPVVVSLHSPLYKEDSGGKFRMGNSDILVDILGKRNVHFMSGHTHVMYNVVINKHFEHNAGAICGTWWKTQLETPGLHMSTDGTPGGYLLFEVDGKDFKWIYKATGRPLDYQFRSYDRNQICFSRDVHVPDATDVNAEKFMNASSDYTASSTANEVILNIWNYDPMWRIEVLENGVNLKVVRKNGKDPLHFLAYSAKSINKNMSADFSSNTSHMFKVTASSATSTLEIKITDGFGNTYTETMVRPKAFTIENYI